MLLGIDLGGTKIEGVVLKSRNSLSVKYRYRINTQESKGYRQVLLNIKHVVNYLEKRLFIAIIVSNETTVNSNPQTALTIQAPSIIKNIFQYRSNL